MIRLEPFLFSTVWKHGSFSATQISSETKFGNFETSKIAILTTLEALNFDFWSLLGLKNDQIYQNQNSEPLKLSKTVDLGV